MADRVVIRTVSLCGVPVRLDLDVSEAEIWIEWPSGKRALIWPPPVDFRVTFGADEDHA
jgi:hypothetical protein